jgi:hypothetical protein
MQVTETTLTEQDAGCWFDSHRGHYIVRDVVAQAIEFGYIISDVERYALDRYDEAHSDEDYPHEWLTELSEDVIAWLNIGDNSGLDRPIKGQNNPPAIPADYYWSWFDGDFGLYPTEED